MNLLLLSLTGFASAAEVAAGGIAPDMNVQSFRPSVDSYTFFRLTDSNVAPEGAFLWRATTSWSKDPLQWTDYFGNDTSLVGNLVQTDLAAGYSLGRLRLGVDVPVVWRSFGATSDLVADATGLGDVTLDGKLRVLDGGVGVAVSARTFVPTSTLGAPLAGAFGGEVEVAADTRIGDKIVAAGTLGTVLRDAQDMENVPWGSQFHVGLGAAYSVSESVSAVAEIDANGQFSSLDQAVGRPSEALVGANVTAGKLLVRPAVAFSLGDAVGVPAWRAVLAVGSAPFVAPPPVLDADGDGLADTADACPDKAEDRDSYADTDGCPEPTEVRVKVVDSDGIEVKDAGWTIGSLSGKPGDTVKLEAGNATVSVGTVQKAVVVPAGPPMEVVVTVPAPRGTIVVNIVDKNGKPVPNAAWSASGPTSLKGQPAGSYPLRPGSYSVSATAPGFKKLEKAAEVQKDGTITLVLDMEPSKAELSGAKIEIKDSVYFETGKAIIKPESFALLDEVAGILADHPELTRIRVEGHTDSRGDNAKNKALSQSRAASVVTYLVGKGVAADRLESIGYGEEKPLVKEVKDTDRAKNRRVDFAVVGRSDGAQHGEIKQIDTQGDKPRDK
ncbi:MAG: hypothetical protein RLZZ299_2109 [Pseudomonadota bacterium]